MLAMTTIPAYSAHKVCKSQKVESGKLVCTRQANKLDKQTQKKEKRREETVYKNETNGW